MLCECQDDSSFLVKIHTTLMLQGPTTALFLLSGHDPSPRHISFLGYLELFDFLLSIPVLTWPQPLNRVPKPRSCLTHKLLCTAQDFPDRNVHMYMCISKKTTLNANFPEPFDDSNRKWGCKCWSDAAHLHFSLL